MGSQAKILIVEDIDEQAHLLERLLTGAGFAARRASNGKEALEAVQTEHPDLVLLDLQMPVMDGIAACRALRNAPGLDNMPIIVLTVEEEIADYVRALKTGADDYILKSAGKEDLVRRVETWLARAKTGSLPPRFLQGRRPRIEE